MAIKEINTRIKNRIDTLANWKTSGLSLLPGEVAIVQVDTLQENDADYVGKALEVAANAPTILMKVGGATYPAGHEKAGQPMSFKDLPWLSAKASDVYSWAKNEAAEDIPVAIYKGADQTATSDTLGSWLKEVYDKNAAQTADISSINLALGTLTGAENVSGSIAEKIKTAITALSVTDAEVSGKFVTKVSESAGKISITRAAITEADLPEISAAKIVVSGTGDAKVTLNTKLGLLDARISEIDNKQVGHTDDQIKTLITNELGKLDLTDPASTGAATEFITSVSQDNGQISATKGTLPVASSTTAGIMTLGVSGGAAAHNTVAALVTDVADLKVSVTGGVHFIGEVISPANLAANSSTSKVTLEGNKQYNAGDGDVVIQGDKEFIWSGSSWKELGDLSRVGAVETAIANMKSTTTRGSSQFVSQVTQADGKISVSYDRPSAADISHGDSNVQIKLSAIDAAIAEKADAVHTHPYAPSAHAHGNISSTGTITSSAVTTATGVLVYDSTNTIQKATAAKVREIIGAGTSSLSLGTTSSTAAAGNHTHSDLASRISDAEGKLNDVSSTVGAAITAKIDTISHASDGTTGSYVTNITQSKGKVTVTKGNLPNASTSSAGIVQLNNTTTSTSTVQAATASVANSINTIATGAQKRVAEVESNYIRCESSTVNNQAVTKMYLGIGGTDEIIFDCGGVEYVE